MEDDSGRPDEELYFVFVCQFRRARKDNNISFENPECAVGNGGTCKKDSFLIQRLMQLTRYAANQFTVQMPHLSNLMNLIMDIINIQPQHCPSRSNEGILQFTFLFLFIPEDNRISNPNPQHNKLFFISGLYLGYLTAGAIQANNQTLQK